MSAPVEGQAGVLSHAAATILAMESPSAIERAAMAAAEACNMGMEVLAAPRVPWRAAASPPRALASSDSSVHVFYSAIGVAHANVRFGSTSPDGACSRSYSLTELRLKYRRLVVPGGNASCHRFVPCSIRVRVVDGPLRPPGDDFVSVLADVGDVQDEHCLDDWIVACPVNSCDSFTLPLRLAPGSKKMPMPKSAMRVSLVGEDSGAVSYTSQTIVTMTKPPRATLEKCGRFSYARIQPRSAVVPEGWEPRQLLSASGRKGSGPYKHIQQRPEDTVAIVCTTGRRRLLTPVLYESTLPPAAPDSRASAPALAAAVAAAAGHVPSSVEDAKDARIQVLEARVAALERVVSQITSGKRSRTDYLSSHAGEASLENSFPASFDSSLMLAHGDRPAKFTQRECADGTVARDVGGSVGVGDGDHAPGVHDLGAADDKLGRTRQLLDVGLDSVHLPSGASGAIGSQ